MKNEYPYFDSTAEFYADAEQVVADLRSWQGSDALQKQMSQLADKLAEGLRIVRRGGNLDQSFCDELDGLLGASGINAQETGDTQLENRVLAVESWMIWA